MHIRATISTFFINRFSNGEIKSFTHTRVAEVYMGVIHMHLEFKLFPTSSCHSHIVNIFAATERKNSKNWFDDDVNLLPIQIEFPLSHSLPRIVHMCYFAFGGIK